MKNLQIPAVLMLLAIGAVWTLQAGCAVEKAAKDAAPAMATIVKIGITAADGVGEAKAIHINNPEKLAALESFFPNYRQRPSSNRAAGWVEGYRVHFDFPGGDRIRVSVSDGPDRSEPDLWSTGKGDFETNGDFKAFVSGLVKKE